MVSSPSIFLAPCSNDDAQEHLERTVIEGVAKDTYGQFTPINFGETVSVWGVKDGNKPVWEQLQAGDYIFFYTGDETYTQVSRVLGTEYNNELAAELWPGFDDSWSYILYLEEPLETAIDANEIQAFANYDRYYILGFQSLNPEGHEGIRDAYGSIEAYVRKHSVDEGSSDQFTLPEATSPESDTEELLEPRDTNSVVDPEYVDDEQFAMLERQLTAAKQIVLYGPPGTGKTYTATNFARWWLQQTPNAVSEQLQVVTFHPSFTYEDFLEGLTATAANGGVDYNIEPGIFKEFCAAAEAALEATPPDESPPRYLLIIDEINRGNLAQIFGETITLLEPDKRGSVTTNLAHSGEPFSIPPNVYVIGTMNTADRSVALVDAALRRRFRFLDFPPAYEVLYSYFGIASRTEAESLAEDSTAPTQQLQALSLLAVERINQMIIDSPDLGRGKQIGHTYLFIDSNDSQALVDVWRYELLPLLEEYFFGQFDRIRSLIFDGDGEELIDWDQQRIRDFTKADLRNALADVVGVEL